MKLGRVDADAHKALATKYGINGYPVIMVFVGDKSKPYQYSGKIPISPLLFFFSFPN